MGNIITMSTQLLPMFDRKMMINYGILNGFKLQLWVLGGTIQEIQIDMEMHGCFFVHLQTAEIPCPCKILRILISVYLRVANLRQILNPPSLHVEDCLLRPSTPEPRGTYHYHMSSGIAIPLLRWEQKTYVSNIELIKMVSQKLGQQPTRNSQAFHV